jgi:hypothetical protein
MQMKKIVLATLAMLVPLAAAQRLEAGSLASPLHELYCYVINRQMSCAVHQTAQVNSICYCRGGGRGIVLAKPLRTKRIE